MRRREGIGRAVKVVIGVLAAIEASLMLLAWWRRSHGAS